MRVPGTYVVVLERVCNSLLQIWDPVLSRYCVFELQENNFPLIPSPPEDNYLEIVKGQAQEVLKELSKGKGIVIERTRKEPHKLRAPCPITTKIRVI